MQLPRLSAVETLVLELLSEHRELYGLQLIEASRGKLKRGTVYVTLSRMEDKGYVTRRELQGEGRGPARCMYRLTGHGGRVLAAWQMASAAVARGVAS
jgi:PadR family transcriptional regulator PadR